MTTSQQTRHLELVGIEVTRVCNLRCPHCFSAATRRPRNELDTSLLKNLLDQIIELGPPRAIGWTGGEPLLCEDLAELIEYAYRKARVRSGITTNGLLLDSNLAKRLADAGTYAVQISVDGSTAERFAMIRAADPVEFELVLRGMDAVKESGMQLHLAMILGKPTLHDARPFIEFAAAHGAAGVRFCGFVPAGRGRNEKMRKQWELGSDSHELLEFIEFASSITKPAIMFDPGFGPLPPDFEFHECTAGTEMMYISSTGAVYPCTSLIDSRFEIGNVHNRSLESIWNDPRMTEIANYDMSKVEGDCRSCTKLPGCHAGCRGVAYAYSGHVNAACPNCLFRTRSCLSKAV